MNTKQMTGRTPSSNPQQKTGAHPQQATQKSQQPQSISDKGQVFFRRRPRWSAFLDGWVLGLLLLPLGGLGVLIWVHYFIVWRFTVIEVCGNVIVVRSVEFSPNPFKIFQRKTIFIRYFHVKDLVLEQNVFDFFSNNGRIITYVDAQKVEAGRLKSVSDPNTPEDTSDSNPRMKKIVLLGLGNYREMSALFEFLMKQVAYQRIKVGALQR